MKTYLIHSWLATRVPCLLLLAGVCGLAGCLSRPALTKQTFAFGVPASSATNFVAGSRVLGLRKLRIAVPFEGRSLVYRTGEFTFVPDPYAEFLDAPEEELVAPVCGWLRANGGFSAVADPGSALRPDTWVEINVSELFGDFRQPEHAAAIMTMRFVFLDAPGGVPGKVLLQQEYSRRIPLSAPTAAALMAGWNEALAGILGQATADFRNRPGADSGTK